MLTYYLLNTVKMKLDEGVAMCSTVVTGIGGRAQRLVVESSGTLALYEGSLRLRSWPLHIARLRTDLPVSMFELFFSYSVNSIFSLALSLDFVCGSQFDIFT